MHPLLTSTTYVSVRKSTMLYIDSSSMLFTLFIIMYLLLTLFAVVKLWMTLTYCSRYSECFFFIRLYSHIGRGIYYSSYNYFHTTMIGVLVLFLNMGSAFLGYVLPWE